ncbi:MAG: hypothetical protein LQ337_002963 [Flavoplaca oasis]|nr:MAG: hypothetical protein LQ337_002963 [Flavoplaca oasis]
MLLHRGTAFKLPRILNAIRHRAIDRTGLRGLAAHLPPRIVVSEDDIQESFLKGSGPGGQKINKTSSAVQLKHLPTGIVVKSQATRSRSQNRSIARRLLSDQLENAEKGSESRTALKAESKRKKKASMAKKARRKHRSEHDPSYKDGIPSHQNAQNATDKAPCLDDRKS